MIRFFRPGEEKFFHWIGIVQRGTVKTLIQISPFSETDLRSVAQFCYPTLDPISGPLSYVFRFKSSDGNFYNGFCLLDQTSFQLRDLDTNQQCCICIISQYYHFTVFEDILKVLRSLLLHGLVSAKHFLEVLKNSPQSLTSIPSLSALFAGGIPYERHLRPLVQTALDILPMPEVARLVIALLTDTPVIVVSTNLSLLTTFCYSLAGLIAPLQWFHLFAPVLPSNALETIQSPAPFIVGLHRVLMPKIVLSEIESHILVDLDEVQLVATGLDALPGWVGHLVAELKGGSIAELNMFIVLLICNAIGVQPANSPRTTLKRILTGLESVDLDLACFTGCLFTSRTVQPLLDGLREVIVPPQYARLLAMGNTSQVTSPAIQELDAFPQKKVMSRSHSDSGKLRMKPGSLIPPRSPFLDGVVSADSEGSEDLGATIINRTGP
jgi:hypothetical protein